MLSSSLLHATHANKIRAESGSFLRCCAALLAAGAYNRASVQMN